MCLNLAIKLLFVNPFWTGLESAEPIKQCQVDSRFTTWAKFKFLAQNQNVVLVTVYLLVTEVKKLLSMSSCSFLLLLLFYSSSLLVLIFVSYQISLKNIALMPCSSATTDKIRLVLRSLSDSIFNSLWSGMAHAKTPKLTNLCNVSNKGSQ